MHVLRRCNEDILWPFKTVKVFTTFACILSIRKKQYTWLRRDWLNIVELKGLSETILLRKTFHDAVLFIGNACEINNLKLFKAIEII